MAIMVGPDGIRKVNPELLDAQARGMAAQSEYNDMQRGPAMANALRMSNARLGDVEGRGASATAPSGWNALATVLERQKGQSQLNAMQEQANALRGDISEGQRAQLQRQDDLAQREFDYRRFLEKQRTKREDQSRREGFQNDKKLLQMKIDAKKNKGKTEDLTDYGQDLLTSSQRSRADGHFKIIRTAGDIKNIASTFTEEDVRKMNMPALSVAINAATPAAFESYVQNNQRGFSTKVKNFMTRLSALSAKQRYDLFGAALTRNEGKSAEEFIVGGKGLVLGDTLNRLDMLVKDSRESLQSMDDSTGSRLRDVPSFSAYEFEEETPEEAPAEAAAPKASPGEKLTIEQMNFDPETLAQINELKEIQGDDFSLEALGFIPPATPQKSERSLTRSQRRSKQAQQTKERNRERALSKAIEAQEKTRPSIGRAARLQRARDE